MTVPTYSPSTNSFSSPVNDNGVAEDVGVSQCSVSNVIWEVATAVKVKARNCIQFPSSTAALEEVKAERQERYKFHTPLG